MEKLWLSVWNFFWPKLLWTIIHPLRLIGTSINAIRKLWPDFGTMWQSYCSTHWVQSLSIFYILPAEPYSIRYVCLLHYYLSNCTPMQDAIGWRKSQQIYRSILSQTVPILRYNIALKRWNKSLTTSPHPYIDNTTSTEPNCDTNTEI